MNLLLLSALLSAHSILMPLFTLASAFPWRSHGQSPLPCPWKVLHLVPWQSCHQTEASDPLRSDFPCQSVHCCLSLFKGDFLSSKLSNLKNNELNSPSLFRESTFPEQRERSFRNLASIGWALYCTWHLGWESVWVLCHPQCVCSMIFFQLLSSGPVIFKYSLYPTSRLCFWIFPFSFLFSF